MLRFKRRIGRSCCVRATTTQRNPSQQALSGFCEAYWPPLYSFLRHRGFSSADAQDLVQGFFAHLLEQNTLTRADQQKGRLRTFLLGSLQNFLYNEYDRARALKRGGGRQVVSIEEHLPEAEAAMMATAHLSDAACYDLVWASTIVSRAWQNLETAFVAEGKAEWLEELRPFVAGGSVTTAESGGSRSSTRSADRHSAHLAFASSAALPRIVENGSGEYRLGSGRCRSGVTAPVSNIDGVSWLYAWTTRALVSELRTLSLKLREPARHVGDR